MTDDLETSREGDAEFSDNLRIALRGTVVNVALLTTRDRQGTYHGLAVTTAVPFSPIDRR